MQTMWNTLHRYLDALSVDERWRVMNTQMAPYTYATCLVGTVIGLADPFADLSNAAELIAAEHRERSGGSVEIVYDSLCGLIGSAEVNQQIRRYLHVRAMEIGDVERIVRVEPEPFALPHEIPIEPAHVVPEPIEEPELVPA